MMSRRSMVCLSVGLSALVAATLWWFYPEYVAGMLGLILVDISQYPRIRIHPVFLSMVAAGFVLILIAIVLASVDRARPRKLH
jgi:uncharacterized membrane protein YjjP (DUF1212 family)